MTTSLKHLAVAAVAAASFASAQAASFANKAENFFTVDPQLTAALASFAGDVQLSATGGAAYDAGVLSFVASNATFATTTGADLVETSTAGLSLTALGTTITLSNLGFNASTGKLSGVMAADGNTLVTGDLLELTSAPYITTKYTFDQAIGSGSLLTGTFHMTNAAAKKLGFTLGGLAGQLMAPTIQGYAFGTMAVNVPEPSTYALMGLGLMGVALTARKRKSA